MVDEKAYKTFAGTHGAAIAARLSSLSSAYDFVPGQTVRLLVRAADNTTVVLDVEADVDTDSDVVSYAPMPTDFPNSGMFKGWWHIVDVDSDSEEFDIVVLSHGPGVGTSVGPVYRAARSLSPVAWNALRGYPDYGDVELQRSIELAKLRTYKTAVSVVEESAIDARVVDYLAKKTLVDSVLPAAMDFWSDQLISQTALGNSTEVRTYPDRIKAVKDQIDLFTKALADQLPEVVEIIGSVSVGGQGAELFGGGDVVTPTLGDVDRMINGCSTSVADWRLWP